MLLLAMTLSAIAQTNKPITLKGTIDIAYNSRVKVEADGKPKPAVNDVYKINLNMSDSAVFRGTIEFTPLIAGMLDRISQPASLNYNVDCDVVNPANPAQTKNVGRMFGVVPIDANGTYNYTAGSMKIIVNQIGTAQGFESKFTGTAAGKPLLKSQSLLSGLKKEVLSFTKQVQGKTVAIAVKKYDKMTFTGHQIASGPVQSYPEVTVNGTMIYDYDRYAWYFQNMTLSYADGGVRKEDKLSGSIRWSESPKVGNERIGEYTFDVRVNEPMGEATAFASTDESDFFKTDDTLAALVGTMKYRDAFVKDSVASSDVTVNLVGNKINRQQGMAMVKLLIFSCVVPMNAE